MDNFMPWMIRPQAQEIRQLMLEYLRRRTATARVYLQVNGKRTVSEIGTRLKMKQPNVSREIAILFNEMGLVEPIDGENGTIYRKTKIDKIIGLSRALEKPSKNAKK
jgi:DNA-binding transcriptional ArsR family regulator